MLRIGKRIEEQSYAGQVLPSMYVFSGSVNETLYKDITDNKNWMTVGLNEYDYQFCRSQVMEWTQSEITKHNHFSGLTTDDQTYAAMTFSVTKTERDLIRTEVEQETDWARFVDNMRASRTDRWDSAKKWISYRLDPLDSIDIAETTNTLSNNYLLYGVESNADDGVDGLFDWLENTSSYSGGTGFSGKTYWTQELQDGIIDILKNGNY
jgi:hypothetical protein